ncbi:MAG: hypothetical protein CG439_552 [Methylococcaceae bacterium NSP1-2]|nr:MAG: hypothetical protein CG439_552 [Methylococcaceae bacterium NSP1-2]
MSLLVKNVKQLLIIDSQFKNWQGVTENIYFNDYHHPTR